MVNDALEERIGAALDAGDHGAATRLAIEGYGPEILGYLAAVARSTDDAEDVFSMFCEDLWRAMPAFRRAASMRTWGYKLARHALSRFARDPYRMRGRRLATHEYSELAAQLSSKLSRERGHAKLEVARAALDDDEQTLLILRVDRKLPWNDIAEVMAEADDAAPDAAALRKRFERIKAKLRDAIKSTDEP